MALATNAAGTENAIPKSSTRNISLASTATRANDCNFLEVGYIP
jgi:hypothetical protein